MRNDGQISSLCFGYNAARIIEILILTLVFAYLLWRGDSVEYIFGLILLLILIFNVRVEVDANLVTISICWIKVRKIKISDIAEINYPIYSPFFERITSGVHFVESALLYHAGPATIEFVMKNQKKIRATVKEPELFIAACKRRIQ